MTTRSPIAYNLRPLWFGTLTGPLIWAVHLMASYTVVTLACYTDFAQFSFFGFAGTNLLILLITLGSALLVFLAGQAAYRHWQRLGGNLERGVQNLPEFMALLGILSSGLFLATILVAGLPAVYLQACL